MTDTQAIEGQGERRTRQRRSGFRLDKPMVVDRVVNFYMRDLRSRQDDIDRRLQRYAKFRAWTEGKDWPWEDASDVGITDMMEMSQRIQDTLFNAVMSQDPPIVARALHHTDQQKQMLIDRLLQYQFFVDQPGDQILGEMIESFINDGVFTAYIPWITERREANETRLFDPIPGDLRPIEYFLGVLRQSFPEASFEPDRRTQGWDWKVTPVDDEEVFDVKFYTQSDGRVELVISRQVVVHDGPRVLPKDYADVLYPGRARNLQIPGPSNPEGASHVILRDYPTVDEVRRLIRNGFYDLADDSEFEALANVTRSYSDQETQLQEDRFRGYDYEIPQDQARSHRTLTRLMCFDMFDVDGDGVDEDVIFWVILETKSLLKARKLSDLFPSVPPRRPLVRRSFLEGDIGLLELMEGMHDMMKIILDQMIDAGTLANAPFGFYRASSSVKPEIIQLSPGELYPLSDPSRDINFPQILNQAAQGFSLNLFTILQQMEERATLIGDLQLGRVPVGRSAALRTTGNVALLTGQAESRPERLLRRFFGGLAEIWSWMHELNRHFLDRGKEFRIIGIIEPGTDPYQFVDDVNQIDGRFDFTFDANILNTSKTAMQQSLSELMGVFINPLTIQLGLVGPEEIYRLMRDFGRAQGQQVDHYLRQPNPFVHLPKAFVEEQISAIQRGQVPPRIQPAEPGGWQEHLKKLMDFVNNFNRNDELAAIFTPESTDILRAYVSEVRSYVEAEQQQQDLQNRAAAANQQFQQRGQQGPGAPAQGFDVPQGNPSVSSGNELLDETLPTAGGGANRNA